jgi:beta-phosphoglucomutase family hydrolase
MSLDDHLLSFDAVIFDLDGVITKTAIVHTQSWKKMFDVFLKEESEKTSQPFQEFTQEDYLTYVDGKPRYKGVQSFLESRNICIDFGDPKDSADQKTICGLGNQKNIEFTDIIETKGVEVYQSTVDLIHDLKSKNIHVGVASSSKNCQIILQKVGLEDVMETRVDGVVSVELGLKGKPEADIFITAAQNMGVEVSRSVVVEDAVSGVQAGANGKFGLVIGVARENNSGDLAANGADIVIEDFKDIKTETINQWFTQKKN